MTDYAELHCHSNFSLLDGASHPADLAARAAALGMPTLALTDHDAVYGAVRFASAARAAGVRPVFGAELTLEGNGHLTLLVENAAGWRNLCRLISRARRDVPKGEAALPPDALEGRTEGLIALSGCRQGAVRGALDRGDRDGALRAAKYYKCLFGLGRFWVELQHHLLPGDGRRVAELADLADHLGIGVVATNDVHYAARGGHRLQDALVCIRHLTELETSGHLLRANSEFYLKGARRMAPLFADHPEALANTLRVAERCAFEPAFGLQDLPAHPTPDGLDAAGYLRRLCEDALPSRYPGGEERARTQLDHELGIIARMGLANYFLLVWDIMAYARRHGIRGQGRGSAANSLVAYLLGISPIDPLSHNLVFERFLSEERRMPPDIDIDFDAARRKEVIQYVSDRYGRDRAAMACTFVTFRARSAVRDVGRALGFPPTLLDQAAKALDTYSARELAASATLRDELGGEMTGELWKHLFELCGEIHRFPRHLGIHNGGMVITGPPLANYVPTEPAAMPGRTVIQWDRHGLEDSGLVKIDLLGLRMLSVLSDAVETVEVKTGERPDLDALTFDDPAIYAMIQRGDTVGLFQIESNAQRQLHPRLKPKTFEDLIVAISLIRPGPLQGDMVHPYLRRRAGEEPVTYADPRLKPFLEETLGVVVYQEQVLKVACGLAGLSPGQGEALRRALGSDLSDEVIEALREGFVQGAVANGASVEVAHQVYDLLKAFGGYAFPKSHAGAFAVIVYQSAWLKRYHPAPFYAALLNNQPMGFWSPSVLVNDAKLHGVEIRPVDVNRSDALWTVEGRALRAGLSYVRGLGEVGSERVVEARGDAPFRDLADVCRRTRLPRRLVENLVRAGALDGLGLPRRRLLWELGKTRYQVDELDLVFAEDGVRLRPLPDAARLGWELDVTGVSTGEHPIALYRDWLDEQGILGSAGLAARKDGERVRVAGVVIMRQAPPTARGMRFITLEDECGMLNVIVRPQVYERYRRVFRSAPVLLVDGTLQRENGVTNIIAGRAAALGE